MCAALTCVLPTMRLGSVNENASRPRAVRAVLIALRSSTMWTALITQSPPTRFGSVKVKGPVTLNVAVTTVAPTRVTVQAAVPEQLPPLQPANTEPPSGITVSVTTVPLTKLAEQLEPQLMPAGVLVTVPMPALETVSVKVWSVKVAVIVVAAEIVTVQVPVPVHSPPLQPVKAEPASGVAVSVTTVPSIKSDAHVLPHEIPSVDDVTLPLPVPCFSTVRVKVGALVQVYVEGALVSPNWLVAFTWKVCSPRARGPRYRWGLEHGVNPPPSNWQENRATPGWAPTKKNVALVSIVRFAGPEVMTGSGTETAKSTARMRLFPVSATKRLPTTSRVTP